MKHVHFHLLNFAIVLFTLGTQAQQVVATSGNYYEGDGVTMSVTIGEPVTETYFTGNVILTQGFQQPGGTYLQQILNIPQGWSGISSYIDPLNKDIEDMFSSHQNDLIVLTSMTGIYFPSQQINTLGTWDYYTGYQIKAENQFSLNLTGSKTATQTVQLNAGWNLIPVLSSCEVPVENCFESLTDLTIVKQVAGPYIYWPAYNINTLQSLLPGKSYYVNVTNDGNFTYPACEKSSVSSWQNDKPANRTPWNDIHYAASSHVIAFPRGILRESGILAGDVMGVFTADGLCAGQSEIIDPELQFSMVAFGNDSYTVGKDGFDPAENLNFKVFRPENDWETEIDVEFENTLPQLGQFAEQGLSAVKNVLMNTSGISENYRTAEIYPNPSQGVFTVVTKPVSGIFQIVIMDLTGQALKTIEIGDGTGKTSFTLDPTGLPKGMYFVNITDGIWSEVKKIVIN